MREFQQKQKLRKRLYSIPSLIALSILLVLIGKGTYEIVGKVRVSREHVKNLEEKAAALSVRSQELQDDISRLETEDGVKRELKERFNVVEDGEKVVVVVDEKSSTSSAKDGSGQWFGGIWNKVKSIF
jgi:cell division protein FtsB